MQFFVPEFACNAIGTVIFLYYFGVVYSAFDKDTQEGSKESGESMKNFAISCGLFSVVCGYVLQNGVGDKTTIQHVGYLCMVINVIMYGAPLSTLGTVVKTRSSSTLPFQSCLMGGFVSMLWFSVGWLKNDLPTMVPNGIGMALSLIQLSLFVIYPSNSKSGSHMYDEEGKEIVEMGEGSDDEDLDSDVEENFPDSVASGSVSASESGVEEDMADDSEAQEEFRQVKKQELVFPLISTFLGVRRLFGAKRMVLQ